MDTANALQKKCDTFSARLTVKQNLLPLDNAAHYQLPLVKIFEMYLNFKNIEGCSNHGCLYSINHKTLKFKRSSHESEAAQVIYQ